MDEPTLGRIDELIVEEHDLRARHPGGLHDADVRRLQQLEVELDRCWDLLRQRRALREFGDDPEEAQVRPADTVEHYQQ